MPPDSSTRRLRRSSRFAGRFAWPLLMAAMGASHPAWGAGAKLQCDELTPTYASPAMALAAAQQRTTPAPATVAARQRTTGATHLPYAAPLANVRLTSAFGSRVHPIHKTVLDHGGIDLAAPTGTPVMAAADGIVDFAGADRLYGNYVVLRHGNGQQTYYGHLSAFEDGLKAGQAVQQGQRIGKVGSTGQSTGPHLHFEVRERGQPIDPQSLTAGIGALTAKSTAVPTGVHSLATRAEWAMSPAALLGDTRNAICTPG